MAPLLYIFPVINKSKMRFSHMVRGCDEPVYVVPPFIVVEDVGSVHFNYRVHCSCVRSRD